MVDTIRGLAALQALLADNVAQNISPQDVRDFLVSSLGGFGAYDDLATKSVRLNLVAGVRHPYECDAGGPQGETGFLPYPKIPVTDELWDATNDRILLDNLPAGSRIIVRLNFTINPASPNTGLDLFIRFSNSSDVFIFELDVSVAEIKTTGDHGEVVTVDFFIGSVIQDGFVDIEFLSSNNATVEIGGIYINVLR